MKFSETDGASSRQRGGKTRRPCRSYLANICIWNRQSPGLQSTRSYCRKCGRADEAESLLKTINVEQQVSLKLKSARAQRTRSHAKPRTLERTPATRRARGRAPA